jgi:hypothetical protein
MSDFFIELNEEKNGIRLTKFIREKILMQEFNNQQNYGPRKTHFQTQNFERTPSSYPSH